MAFLVLSFVTPSFQSFFRSINLPARLLFFSVIGLLIISSSFAADPLLALYGATKSIEMIFLGLSLTWYFITYGKKASILLTTALIGATVIVSVLALLQYAHAGSLNGVWYLLGERAYTMQTPGIAKASINGEIFLRPYATFPHPNVLAAYIVLAQAILLSQQVVKKTWIIWLTLVLSSMGLFLTLGRSAILVWCGLVLLAVMKKLSVRMSIALVVLLIGGLSFLPIGQYILGTSLNSDAVTIRATLSKQAIDIFQTHALIGVGPLGFIPSIADLPNTSATYYYLQPVHNIFLLVLSELGIVGIIFMAVFVGILLSSVRSSIRKKIFLPLVLFMIILLLGMTDHFFLTLQQGQLLLVLSISLIISSPFHTRTGGRSSFNSPLRKNTRTMGVLVMDTRSSHHQNKKNSRSATIKK